MYHDIGKNAENKAAKKEDLEGKKRAAIFSEDAALRSR
jgi:hypothetical protein